MGVLCAILVVFFVGCVSGVGIMAIFSASKYDDNSNKRILRQLPPPPHQKDNN